MAAPPPKPAPKPGKVSVYRALYNYQAQQPDELSFSDGDIIYVSDSSDPSGWWRGTCNGKAGLIPSNYVSDQAESIDFPLHEAAKRGNFEFLQQCIRNKVSVNMLDKSGSTALYWASHGGYVDCAKALLAIPNVSIDAQNKLGDSALHAAAWKGHPESAALLLQAGAVTSLKNKDGKTPFDLAKDPDTAALLKRHSINSTAMDAKRAAEYAASDDDDRDSD